MQDDDASLAPDPKRRRTDTPTGADIAYDAAEEGTIPFESHRLALSESYFPVKGDVASGTSQSVEPGPVKEELGDLRIPTTHAASPESVAHAISHLLDQSRRKDTSKQAIPVDSNAALLKANSNLKAQSLPILDNLVGTALDLCCSWQMLISGLTISLRKFFASLRARASKI